ncbi:BrnT family toxin [candidate division KSB1 bacterium]|nr:BrnT family toxin [candidate division KSB1 bacterium]
MKLTFEWNEEKAISNYKKHKVTFEEGKSIFNDPFLLTFPDAEHSEFEKRYINLGISLHGRILVLIHTERKNNIRIISCRKATLSERKVYEKRGP